MSWGIGYIKNIANNLDYKRKPLNEVERDKISDNNGYPYIGANNIVGFISKYIFDENILCIAEDGGYWGKNEKCANYYTEKCWVNNHAHVLSFNGKADLKYLMYYLNSEDLSKYITGSTRGKLTKSSLDSIAVPLPPLSIQKRISDALSSADALRVKDQELVEKYNSLAKAIFNNMFSDPIKNDKYWEVKRLNDISTNIHSGNTPKGGSNVYVKDGITFFRSQNVWKNRLVYDDIAFIDEATHKSMNKSSLKHGDILITKTGRINTENSSLGRAALYEGRDDRANINGHVYLVRLKEDVIRKFVLFILTTDEYRDYIRSVCVGGIDKRQLNKEHIEDFPIIFPPVELQKQFIERLTLIEEQKKMAQESLKKSEKLFEDILHKAFKGELIKEKEIEIIG